MMESVATLPDLTKQLKRREAEFGLQFRKWVKPGIGVAFELKHTHDADSLEFSEVKSEQLAYLVTIKLKGELLRIMGGNGEPDYVWVCGPAFVVIRYPTMFCLIDVIVFTEEEKDSIRRSLTAKRAREIAKIVVKC